MEAQSNKWQSEDSRKTYEDINNMIRRLNSLLDCAEQNNWTNQEFDIYTSMFCSTDYFFPNGINTITYYPECPLTEKDVIEDKKYLKALLTQIYNETDKFSEEDFKTVNVAGVNILNCTT